MKLKSLSILLAAVLPFAADVHAADVGGCHYFATVEGKVGSASRRGKDVYIILDVIRVPKSEWSEWSEAARKAARSYVRENLAGLGFTEFSEGYARLFGDCTTHPKLIHNQRIAELQRLNQLVGWGEQARKRVHRLGGVWASDGQDTGLSQRILFTDVDDNDGAAPAPQVVKTEPPRESSPAASQPDRSVQPAPDLKPIQAPQPVQAGRPPQTSAAPAATPEEKDKGLIAAVRSGTLESLKRLLAAGANARAKDEEGDSAISIAIERRHAGMIKALAAAGARTEVVEGKSWTDSLEALVCSSARDVENPVEELKAMLEAGLSPETPCLYGNFPLHVAASWNQPDKIRLLLQAGANPARVNKHGKLPLELAREKKYAKAEEILSTAASASDLAAVRLREARKEKLFEIGSATGRQLGSEDFGYACSPILLRFPDQYVYPDERARSIDALNKARSAMTAFRSCIAKFNASITQLTPAKFIDVYSLLDDREKGLANENFKRGLDSLRQTIESDQERFTDEVERLQRAEEMRRSSDEADKRAQREHREWLRNLQQEMANMPVQIQRQRAELDAAIRGTTVEEDERKARQSVDAVILDAEYKAGNRGNASTQDAQDSKAPGAAPNQSKPSRNPNTAANKERRTEGNAGAATRPSADGRNSAAEASSPEATGSRQDHRKPLLTVDAPVDNSKEIELARQKFEAERKAEEAKVAQRLAAEKAEAEARQKAADDRLRAYCAALPKDHNHCECGRVGYPSVGRTCAK